VCFIWAPLLASWGQHRMWDEFADYREPR
jgi:hypothetical protein